MSRHMPSTRHPSTYPPPQDNINFERSSGFGSRPITRQNEIHTYTGEQYNNIIYDPGFSEDESCAEASYYYYHRYGKPFSSGDQQANGCMFSDNSDSSQVPDYEYNKIPSSNRCSRNFSQKSFRAPENVPRRDNYSVPLSAPKDLRRIYPTEENTLMLQVANPLSAPHQIPRTARAIERRQSTVSSEVTSAVVDGCGGHCETFENVCYYFLQVAFAMGILIGLSLCIAGAVLRKSAARNLQVLIYIGAMLSAVSALLLGIQCNARCKARKRKNMLRNRRSTTIPLETLPRNPSSGHDYHEQTLLGGSGTRSVPINIVQMQNTRAQVHTSQNNPSALADDHGIPWWRRKDLQ